MSFKTEIQEITQGSMRSMRVLGKPDKSKLFTATSIMFVVGFLTNLPAVILGRFVDQAIEMPDLDFSVAVPFLGLIVVIVLVKEGLTVYRKYLVEYVATATEKQTKISLVNHVLRTDIAELSQSGQTGALYGKMNRSIEGLVKMIKLSFLDFFPAVFSALAAIIIAFVQKPALASFMILVIPAGLFIVFKQIASQKGIRVTLLREKEKIDGHTVEMFGGIETIRTSDTVDYEVGLVDSLAEKLRKIEIKHHIDMALYDAAKYLNESFFYVLVVSIAIYFATTGVISKGDILTYAVLFMSVLTPLRSFHRILDEAHESSIRVSDLHEMLDTPIDESYAVQGALEGKKGVDLNMIDIKDASFSYGDNKIIKDISLSIQRGEKVGLVGSSGCGKSTLIKLLLRLEHGYKGSIDIDGINLREYSRSMLAAKIGYIPQKVYMFSGTIRGNVTYGVNREVSDNEVIDALTLVNLHTEVAGVLGGLDGHVAEQGGNLSGGQRQRLALARALLEKKPIVVLDEATSALDNTNEAIVQGNIEKSFPDSSLIVIAHRLTTLRNMDRIVVLDKGVVVQAGTFKELSSQTGLFKQFLDQGDNI